MAGTDFDVIVVGAGLVGTAFALALQDSGLEVALVERRPPPQAPAGDRWDSRIYAVSPGSAAFLDRLGIWGGLDRARLAPVYEMRVWGDDGASRLDFSAYQAGVPELACILESGLLQRALWCALEEHGQVRLFCPARCAALQLDEERATLRLEGGDALTARLVVGADGADSWVRSQAGLEGEPRPYRQMGVVANFAADRGHGQIARQWFRSDGVLAWLPLPGDRVSMVWSVWEEQARELLALPEQELCRRVAEAGGHALGGLRLITAAAAFPLRLLRLPALVAPRLALIGDAAHNVHPLAGQGVNLGFRDARELARVLGGRGPQRDCGDYLLLRRYERARKEDILALQGVTDGLQKLFNNRNPLLRPLRNLGLALTNGQPWLKNRLIRQALG